MERERARGQTSQRKKTYHNQKPSAQSMAQRQGESGKSKQSSEKRNWKWILRLGKRNTNNTKSSGKVRTRKAEENGRTDKQEQAPLLKPTTTIIDIFEYVITILPSRMTPSTIFFFVRITNLILYVHYRFLNILFFDRYVDGE